MVKTVGPCTVDEEGDTIKNETRCAVMDATSARAPPLFAIGLPRASATDASVFHVANTRFWEAALLPIAVVVVIAFSSCMDFWIGQFISLSWWYAANFYAMAHAFQVLHPQVLVHPSGYYCSPFGGTGALCLWSAGTAAIEMGVYHLAGQQRFAHAIGTTIYSFFGCLWLHAIIAPWLCIPPSWRLHKFFRYAAEHRLLELPRWHNAAPPVAIPNATNDADMQRPPRKQSVSRGDVSTTYAGHVALTVAGYGLLVTWYCAMGSGILPVVSPQLSAQHVNVVHTLSAEPFGPTAVANAARAPAGARESTADMASSGFADASSMATQARPLSSAGSPSSSSQSHEPDVTATQAPVEIDGLAHNTSQLALRSELAQRIGGGNESSVNLPEIETVLAPSIVQENQTVFANVNRRRHIGGNLSNADRKSVV